MALLDHLVEAHIERRFRFEDLEKYLIPEELWEKILTLLPHDIQEWIEQNNIKRDSVMHGIYLNELVIYGFDDVAGTLIVSDMFSLEIGVNHNNDCTIEDLRQLRIHSVVPIAEYLKDEQLQE